ncbi:insulin-degrading enzyme-like isoform X2 [Cataglyphis hispanica]|uniref:insulin-degrading enzyme-like isoform X2 n=1 Tax=Cataglyphis hispanica TaxID=1086592 RepID=UPI00217FECB6|nr:insulin-degrading enzyme-like isoform X2 [Cataglyphis hispanica]
MKDKFDPCNNIVKSENDNRSYRGMLLPNYMKVLLISDPTTDKAAVALDVKIGSISDPDNLPGLTHLLQHALYLTEKVLEQKTFKTYVSENNGVVNAKMTEDNTNYHFDIAVSEFKHALTLFAKFFRSSTNNEQVISEQAIREELKYLNVDYEMNNGTYKYDKWMLYQLFKWTIDRHHPISKYGTTFFDESTSSSTLNRLTTNIVEKIQNFYNIHYSSHLMSLCVLSKESLDELQDLVEDLFNPIELKNPLHSYQLLSRQFAPVPKCESVYKIWGAHCNTDYKRLYIIFPVDYLMHFPLSMPVRFLIYLFECDGKGSFISVLKDKDWGNSIEAGTLYTSLQYSFIIVAVDLTDEGLEHIDDIMALFFQYVKILKEGGGEFRRIYSEYKEIMELKFCFKEKEPPLKYVKLISKMLQSRQTTKNALIQEFIPIRYEHFIETLMNDFLSPPRMRIYIIAKKYQDFADEYEPRYHFTYRKEMVPMKTLASWMTKTYAKLNLPACNEFIPTMTNIKPCEDNAEEFPTVIWDTQLVRIWYKKDDVFKIPRTTTIFHFISPLAHADVVNANLTLLFVRLIDNSLRKYLYHAASVDLQWELCTTVYGILLKINGFDDKQYLLLEKIIDRMINFKLNPKNFYINMRNHEQFCKMQLEQFKNKEPYQQAQQILPLEIDRHLLAKDQIFEATARRTHSSHRKNESHESSCTQFFYQINERSIQSDVLLDLVQQIINEPCYDILYTEKKLGYIACTGIHRANKIQGLKVLIQSLNVQIHQDIENLINEFMKVSMKDYINNMSKKSFQQNKTLLAKSYHDKKPKTLNDLSNVYWTEIWNQQYKFDRINAKVNYLEKIKINDLSVFFEKIVNTPSKVIIYVEYL